MNTLLSPLTAAVIGCGKYVPGKVGWGQGHAHGHGYKQAFPCVVLCGVDPSEGNLANFGRVFGLPDSQLFRSTAELYERTKPDLVSIATWPALHLPQVLEAVRAGVKMITCEKPLALDNSEIDQMLAACAGAGTRLAVAHQRRYDPRFELVRELTNNGAIGEKPVVTGRVGEQWDMMSWTVHWFDMANFIFDGPPLSVLGGIDHTGERRYNHAVENAAIVFAEYSEGRQAIFISGPESATGFGISVEGTEGFLRMTDTGVRVFTSEGVKDVALAPLPEAPARDYMRLFQDMAQAYVSGGHFRCDAKHTCQATRMAFAVHESALRQRSVSLPSRVKYAPLEIVQHPATGAKKSGLRIAVLADVHHWEEDVARSGRDGLLGSLSRLGHTVSLVPVEQREVSEADLADKDLVVIYHTRRKSTEETRRIVGDWIRSGRPTLVSHCGIGAWDWDEYRKWIGRYWVWADEDASRASGHPVEPCEITEEPGTDLWTAPWTGAWLPRDEVYVRLGKAGPVEDIAWATLNGERHPWAWRSGTMPNVAVLLPGHRADIWEVPVMDSALAAMIGIVAR